MRVYVPATTASLRRLAATRRLEPPVGARAVGASLRDRYPDDVDLQEDAALGEAAEDSLGLLLSDPVPPRRVVLVAEVPAADVQSDGGTSVQVRTAIPLTRVQAIMVDDVAAEPSVAAAIAAAGGVGAGPAAAAAGGAGTGSGARTGVGPGPVRAVEDHALLWFATQELGDLIGG